MSLLQRHKIVARCAVCKGDVYDSDEYEVWEGAYYCPRHSLSYLRDRADQYRRLLLDEKAQKAQG